MRALFQHVNFQSVPSLVCFVHATWGRASLHNSVQLFMWLRARRFSEPTLNHKSLFRDFPAFSGTCIFFFLALSRILSLLLFSSLTLPTSVSPSVHAVGSLTSNFLHDVCQEKTSDANKIGSLHMQENFYCEMTVMEFCHSPSLGEA